MPRPCSVAVGPVLSRILVLAGKVTLPWIERGSIGGADRRSPMGRDATQDTLAAWIEERIEEDPKAWESRAALFESWSNWASASSEHIKTRATFLGKLERRFERGALACLVKAPSNSAGRADEKERPLRASPQRRVGWLPPPGDWAVGLPVPGHSGFAVQCNRGGGEHDPRFRPCGSIELG